MYIRVDFSVKDNRKEFLYVTIFQVGRTRKSSKGKVSDSKFVLATTTNCFFDKLDSQCYFRPFKVEEGWGGGGHERADTLKTLAETLWSDQLRPEVAVSFAQATVSRYDFRGNHLYESNNCSPFFVNGPSKTTNILPFRPNLFQSEGNESGRKLEK